MKVNEFDLVHVTFPNNLEWDIPIHEFKENHYMKDFLDTVEISDVYRDNDYFKCPVCDERSFNRIINCGGEALPPELQLKNDVITDLVDWVIFKISQGYTLDYFEIAGIHFSYVSVHPSCIDDTCENCKEEDCGACPPLDGDEDPEDEIIEIPGNGEFRRQVNGFWQHKHPSHDFWHPMGRYHQPEIKKIKVTRTNVMTELGVKLQTIMVEGLTHEEDRLVEFKAGYPCYEYNDLNHCCYVSSAPLTHQMIYINGSSRYESEKLDEFLNILIQAIERERCVLIATEKERARWHGKQEVFYV